MVTALGYGTTGLSVGQRVFGLTDSYRGGALAEYVAIETRNLAPLPGDVDFTVGASVAMPGLTAWQGLFEHGRLKQYRGIATRYDKTARNFLAALHLAAATIWLN